MLLIKMRIQSPPRLSFFLPFLSSSPTHSHSLSLCKSDFQSLTFVYQSNSSYLSNRQNEVRYRSHRCRRRRPGLVLQERHPGRHRGCRPVRHLLPWTYPHHPRRQGLHRHQAHHLDHHQLPLHHHQARCVHPRRCLPHLVSVASCHSLLPRRWIKTPIVNITNILLSTAAPSNPANTEPAATEPAATVPAPAPTGGLVMTPTKGQPTTVPTAGAGKAAALSGAGLAGIVGLAAFVL
ncbi:hypothetical protein E4U33_000400 [Claviceps sp. LM78 group G4]|nr:hypothetical protein E4U33_000400 [Claviceps sp. LM78 group G4]